MHALLLYYRPRKHRFQSVPPQLQWRCMLEFSKYLSENAAGMTDIGVSIHMCFGLSEWSKCRVCKQVEASPIFSRHWISYLFFQTSIYIIRYSRCLDFSWHVRCPGLLPKLTRSEQPSLAITKWWRHFLTNEVIMDAQVSCIWIKIVHFNYHER